MPFVMELPKFTTFKSVSSIYDCPFSSKCVFYGRAKLSTEFNFNNSKRSLRIAMSSEESSRTGDGVSFLGNSQFVEVIGIGSRKDAALDFCSESPFLLSSSLRFWNIHVKDSHNFQLQERFSEKDTNPRILEAPQFLKSCSKAIILVASAGYGLDHVTAIDVLKTARSRKGFALAIFLRPFSFEGQRRQAEVKDLINKLLEHTNFCIEIDTDTLLKKDWVTLDEALKTANSAVLLSINAISVLISERHQKLIGVVHNDVKELKVSEVMKILESYKEAKIGFGAGNSIKSSIVEAVYDFPFIFAGVENLNGIIICIIASSGFIKNEDVSTSLHTFRQTTEYMGEIIISKVHEPNLDRNTIVTTVVALGGHHQQSNDEEEINGLKDAHLSKEINSPDPSAVDSRIAREGITNDFDKYSEEHETLPSNNYYEIYNSRNYNTEAKENEIDFLDSRTKSSDFYDQSTEETPALYREPLVSWNLEPGYQIAQEWAKERAGASSMLDNLSIFRLPVGVRPPDESKGLNISYTAEFPEPKDEGVVKEQKHVNSSISSWGPLTDAGFLLVRDFYNNASTALKTRNADLPKKQGILSVRAASMLVIYLFYNVLLPLTHVVDTFCNRSGDNMSFSAFKDFCSECHSSMPEAERDSQKKWSPIKEMQYRGGIYRGRCQGGLPEGKGRLIPEDGIIYDGMWRYSKRSGPGAFYFSNGDVFQGSWRDDVMHGKGWFYFHTGDRWFANFWKGKANGESRFYSKSGEVYFGQFQDGWRHGQFLCIDIDGTRCVEMWDEGILVCRKQLDPDTDAG